ncbi:MAG: AsmA family protein [Rhodospirillales bacterium]
MRLLKIAGMVLGVLLVIVAGALFWVSTQDFSKYQSIIADQVKLSTGRDLKINGKFEVKVGLSPSLRVNEVTFQNASWGSRPDLGKFKQLDVELQLIPLILGEIKVSRVVLSGADILLETDKQGRNNWEFNAGKPAAGNQAPANAPSGGSGNLPQIDKLSITDSIVTIKNALTGKNTMVNVKAFDATGIGASGTTKIDLDGTVNNNPVSIKAAIESLFALANGGDGAVDVSIKAGASSVSVVGPIKAGAPAGVKIVAQGDSLASLKPLIGAALPPLGPYALDGRLISAGKDAYRLDVTKLKVGSTEITGNIAISTEGGKPKLTADLSSPRVNAKDFLKDDGKSGSGGASGKGDGRVFPNDPLPVDDLRLANAVLTLKAGELFNDDVKMQNLVFPLTLQNGRLTIKPTVTVSGGSVAIDMMLDASGATPQLTLALQGNNVNVGDLLKMLQNSDVISGGPSTVDIRVRGAGNSVRAIMASLNGSTSVSMVKGVLNNKRIAFLSSDFLKLLTGGGSTTEIYCAVSKFHIVNGVATSDALVFDASNLSARGSGSINLGSEALDLLIHPETKQPALASLAVPIRITGTLANPKANPDLAQGVLEAPKNVLGTVGKAGGSVLGTITGGKIGGSSSGASSGGGGCGPIAAATPPPAAAPNAAKKPAPVAPPAKGNSPGDKVKKLFK